MIKCLVLDRDGLIVHASKDPSSPLYYVLDAADLILKPNVREAFSLIESMARHHGFKVILATKQRCISKGLITRAQVDILNARLEQMIDYRFDAIYVEEAASDKRSLYAAILKDYGLAPTDILLIDDSFDECEAARALGLFATQTSDLYAKICLLFNIST